MEKRSRERETAVDCYPSRGRFRCLQGAWRTDRSPQSATSLQFSKVMRVKRRRDIQTAQDRKERLVEGAEARDPTGGGSDPDTGLIEQGAAGGADSKGNERGRKTGGVLDTVTASLVLALVKIYCWEIGLSEHNTTRHSTISHASRQSNLLDDEHGESA